MDLKSSSQGSKNSLDSERSFLERLELEIKAVLFNVLFQLLKDVEPSIWIARLLSIIQCLQALYFPFHRYLKQAWSYSSVADGMETFLSYFHLVTYLKSSSWTAYVAVFYVCVGLVAVVFLDIFYISYSFTKKNQAFSWPIYSLRTLLQLMITILFYPLLDFFLSIIQCGTTSTSSQLVHKFFPSVVCWSDVHILHAAVAIFTSIFFVTITFLVVLIYFECLQNSNDPSARVSSRPNFFFLLYEVVLIVAFTFLNDQTNDYILIALLLIGSLMIFAKFHFNSPYYNEEFQKIWSFIAALQVWSAILICFAKFLETNLFEGTIIAWIIGIPIIALIIINQRKQHIDILLLNVNKFETGEHLISQIKYLMQLIRWSKTSKTASILLDGYLEVHRQTCQRDDCASKQKKGGNSRVAKNLITASQSIESQAERDKISIVYQVIYQMFFYGVKKFPNNTNLRLAYAFFLMENSKYKQQALQELNQAEQNHPSFDIDFIIFRYKKLIEDEIAESQQDGNMDIVSEMAFQNNLRTMQNNIERCALQHMDFWSQLGEDSPDLGKLNEIGARISLGIQQVEEQWNRLKKMSNNIPKAMRLYGKYTLEVLNDKESSEQLLERARAIHNSNNNNRKVQLYTSNDDIQNESYPTIILTTEQDKFGQVVNMNLAVSNLFGYQKSEVVNRKINLLMPSIHSKYHDQFLENYMNSAEAKFMNRERNVIGKNKSNYVFPCFLSLRTLSSQAQGFLFVGSFRIEKVHRKISYLYTDIEGNIEHISSSSINFLKIDNKFITSKRYNIDEIAPGVFDDKEKYSAKQGANYTFKPLKKEDDPTGQGIEMNVLISELSFNCCAHAGYVVKFEIVQPTLTNQQNLQISHLGTQSKLRKQGVSAFQFTFVPSKQTVVGQYVDQMNSEIHSQRIDDSLLDGNDDATGIDKSHLMGLKEEDNQEQKALEAPQKNYGIGIKRMRLYYDHIAEVEEDRSDSEEDEEGEAQKSIFQDKNDEEEGEDANINEFNSNFKSRKALKAVVNDESEPSSVSNLKRVANVLVLILILLAFLDYFLSSNEFSNIKKNVDLVIYSNRLLAEMQGMLSYLRDLKLMEMGLYNSFSTKAALQTAWKAAVDVSIANIQALKQNITFSDLSVQSAHSYLLNDQQVNLKSSAGQDIQKPFLTAIEIMYTYAQNIIDSSTSIKSAVEYFEWNMFTEFYKYLIQNAEYYVEELSDRTLANSGLFIIWMIIAGVALCLSMLIFIPLSVIVNRSREEILGLFLDIKEKKIKSLYSKCENFINNLQIGEEDDVGSLDDLDRMNEEDPLDSKMKKRKRKFKNSSMNFKQICLFLLLGALVFEAYFFVNYYITYDLLNTNYSLVQELNATSYSESFFILADNCQRQLFYDQTTKMFGIAPATYVTSVLNQLYQLDSVVHQEHASNTGKHDATYNDAFNNVMMLDPCTIVFTLKGENTVTCEAFAEQSVAQGLAVAATRYFENIRYFNSLYQTFAAADAAGTTLTYSSVAPTGVVLQTTLTSSLLKNELLSLLIAPVALEVRTMQTIYIKLLYRYLQDYFSTDIYQHFTDANTKRVALFIIFNVMVFIIYFLIWLPVVSRLSHSIWRTRGMLTMIPLEVIKETKPIQKFIRRYLNEHSVSNY